MISFASDGGGVGPHVDSYDVFLLQVEGKRRWRVCAAGAGFSAAGRTARILADFEPQQTWTLEAGRHAVPATRAGRTKARQSVNA